MKKKTLCIIPLFNNALFIHKKLPLLQSFPNLDICLINDGSSDNSSELIEELEGIVSIHHEIPLGYGSALNSGYDYARDLEYERLIILNPENDDPAEDIKNMLENMDYGYDLVSCSRILENRETATMPEDALSTTIALSERLGELTGFDVTDPLSGILAVELSAMEPMELTDETHGYLLQLWIQSSYFKLMVMEIPATSGEGFGLELQDYEDPSGHFLSILETERYLYPNTSIN